MTIARAVAGLVVSVAVILMVGVFGFRFFMPRYSNAQGDAAALAYRAGAAMVAYGKAHHSFAGADTRVIAVALPIGVGLGLEVTDSAHARIRLRTHDQECRLELVLGDSVPERPVCR